MDGYSIAWLVVLAGALGVAVLIMRALPGGAGTLWRRLLIGSVLAGALLPAPVPNHAEQLAPAFVVSIFEAFFQLDGAPEQSLRILLIGLGAVLLLTALGHYLLGRYFAGPDDADGAAST